ncbi:uncharacterized protein [Temnothorax nylanderi]|uniref:uncharacterized protein n=1 Tax=Temnothorax nylanderi TaxID=102681 RepID=UPI003A872297
MITVNRRVISALYLVLLCRRLSLSGKVCVCIFKLHLLDNVCLILKIDLRSLENAKMVRCIVKNCKNTNTTCTPEEVSFHKIPENQIMREGWYKNIGEVVLPSNTVNARICSMHFTPESFVQPKRKRAAAEKISKRRSLLPSAVPTLYLLPLNEQASREEDNMKVIRREFNLVCPSTSTNTPIPSSTPGPSPAGVTEHLQDLDLPMIDSTSCHETLTSVSTTNRCQEPTNSDNNVQEVSYELLRSDSFPTRSKKKKVVLHKCSTLSLRRTVRSRSKRFTSKTKVHEAEYNSEQGSPPLKRQCRYMDENIISNVPGNTASKEEDPHKTITWLKADLKHHRSLDEFHASSVEKCMQELNSLEMKNKSLTLQLAEREQYVKTILAENIQLKTSIAELNEQLEAAKREKEAALTVRVSEKMKAVLNPYFTEGQIRCLLENKKCFRHACASCARCAPNVVAR